MVLVGATIAHAENTPFVKTHDSVIRNDVQLAPSQKHRFAAPDGGVAGATNCGVAAVAWHSQPVPGGGTLSPIAFANPAVVNNASRIAFIANVDGSAQNQGIFTADAVAGIVVIAKDTVIPPGMCIEPAR